jgi:hypothetical protein
MYNTSFSRDDENYIAGEDVLVENAKSSLIIECILKMEAIN